MPLFADAMIFYAPCCLLNVVYASGAVSRCARLIRVLRARHRTRYYFAYLMFFFFFSERADAYYASCYVATSLIRHYATPVYTAHVTTPRQC